MTDQKRILKVLEATRNFRYTPLTFSRYFRLSWKYYGFVAAVTVFLWWSTKPQVALVITAFFAGLVVNQIKHIRQILFIQSTSLEITDWDKVDAKIKALKSQE